MPTLKQSNFVICPVKRRRHADTQNCKRNIVNESPGVLSSAPGFGDLVQFKIHCGGEVKAVEFLHHRHDGSKHELCTYVAWIGVLPSL